MNNVQKFEKRFYKRSESIVFRKTKEDYGGLSNMASGYPITLLDNKILSSEALYQACRYPDHPDVQEKIIVEKSPMTAKMKSKAFRKHCRLDFDDNKIQIMRWCIRVKLLQNWEKFIRLIDSTGDLSIVEESRKDEFWGAKPYEDEMLVGVNALGRLLMEMRKESMSYKKGGTFILHPPKLPNFKLFGHYIPEIVVTLRPGESYKNSPEDAFTQPELF